MLFITPDQMLVMATKVKDDHQVTFEDLQLLVSTIKKNIEGTKIKVIIPVYPTLSNGNRGWQKHFNVYNEKYHQVNTGETTDEYNHTQIKKLEEDLISSGLLKNKAEDIIFSSLSEFKMLVNNKQIKQKIKRN